MKMKAQYLAILVCMVLVMGTVLTIPFGVGESAETTEQETTDIVLVSLEGEDEIKNIESLGGEVLETYPDKALVELPEGELDSTEIEVESTLPARTEVSVSGHQFDINDGEPALSEEMTIDGYEEGEEGQYIVHMLGPIASDWRQELEEQGVKIITYIPNYAYEVVMTPEQAERVEDNFFVDWVGIYQPAYRIDPQAEPGEVTIRSRPGAEIGSLEEFENKLDIVSIVNLREEGYKLTGEVQTEKALKDIAKMNDVYYVSPYVEPELHGEMSIQQLGGGIWFMDDEYDKNTSLDPEPREGDPEHPYRKHGDFGAYMNQLGYTGEGITVTVADTGVGDGTVGDAGVEDFTGRVIGGYGFGDNEDYWGDGLYHGTGCAGLIMGDTYDGTGATWDEYTAGDMPYYMGQGLASDSELFSAKIFNDNGSWIGPADYLEVVEEPLQRSDTYIHSNSWGASTEGEYTASDEAYDKAVRDGNRNATGNQPVVITTSAGNDGPDDQTMGSPATAKNVITVGGNQPYNPGLGYENPEDMYLASSRGWTEDNRVKPDVIAPAEGILMHNTPQAGGGYVASQGTSFSNPLTAGAATIVVDWYETNYNETPSPAMVKSILINTANSLDPEVGNSRGPIPNEDQGWGVPDISKLEYPMDDPIGFEFEDQESLLETGDVDEHTIAVEDENEPLKITLTWTDKNALAGDSEGGSPTLKNNLDLEVETPSGEVIRGNAFDVLGGGKSYDGFTYPDAEVMDDFDYSGDGWDDVNNVENVYIHPDEVEFGEYTVKVHGTNVPEDGNNDGEPNQDYALTAYNAAEDPAIELERPIAGEYWEVNVDENITWETTEGVGNITGVDLEYSVDGGASWSYIDQGVNDTGVYTWQVPNEPTDQAMIRATVYDDEGGEGMDTTGEFTITAVTPPDVTLTSPVGGEMWHAGDEENITWDSTAGDELIDNVDLEYSTDGGDNWALIDGGISDTGEYTWMIPDETTSKALVRVWVYGEGGTAALDMSDNYFEIVGAPPEPAENLDVEHDGDNNVVTWENSPGDFPSQMMTADNSVETERDEVGERIDSDSTPKVESLYGAETPGLQGDKLMANTPVEHKDNWHSLYGHVETEENNVSWRYDMGTALGMQDASTWHSAALLNLSGYGGSEITEVSYYDTPLGGQPAVNSAVAHISTDENGAPSEPWLASSEVYDGEDTGWINLTLDNPVEVSADEDYWVVIELDDPGDGYYPQGMVYEDDSAPEDPTVEDATWFTGADLDPFDPASWYDGYAQGYGAFGIEAQIEPTGTEVFEVDIGNYTQEAAPGESINVNYTITNTGEFNGTQDIEFKVDGMLEKMEEDVYIETGEVYEGNFTWQTDAEDLGPYYLEVASENSAKEVMTMIGEPKEVTHYTIYRADEETGPWGDPIAVIEADGSRNYEYVDEGMAGEPFDWYVVRAVAQDGIEEQNEDAVPEPGVKPEIEIERPYGGDYWETGADEEIMWNTAEGLGNITEVDLEYSVDGGDSWSYIDQGLNDTGSYTWQVPNEPTNKALIRATVYDDQPREGMDTSDRFTITDMTPPDITLTSPVGGEEWHAGDQEEISWDTQEGSNNISYVDLWYSEDAGEEWIPIDTEIDDTGNYTWTIPNVHTSEAMIRAQVTDEEGMWSQDSSDQFDIIGIKPEAPENLQVNHSKVVDSGWEYKYTSDHRSAPRWGIGADSEDETWWGGMRIQLSAGQRTDVAYSDRDAAEYAKGQIYTDGESGEEPGELIAETENYTPSGQGWVELSLTEPVEIEGGYYWVIMEIRDVSMDKYPYGAYDYYVEDGGWIKEGGDGWMTMPDKWGVDLTFAIEVFGKEYGEGGANNLITWDQSPDEANVSHYNIYRSEYEDGPWNESTFVESVPVTGATETYDYIDEGRGMADDIFWWYIVRSVSNEGREESNTATSREPIPPLPATNPEPGDGAEGVSIEPELSVYVEHREENKTMDVSFYDASNDSLIDTVEDVSSGSRTSVTWTDLDFYTLYDWYVVVDDGELSATSDTWTFRTRRPDAPEITLTR
ncbi:MAG: S8 family serine peptidase, partial [Candidatus Thermoplasmatota archaeon]